MTSSILRPALLIGLLAGALAGCGDKATFPINVNISALAIEPLELEDTISGQKLFVRETGARTVVFPNSLEYGTEYNITAKAPHQNCSINEGRGGNDTAGRRESIQINVVCTVQRHIISVPITSENGAVVAGLQLTNGSDLVDAVTIKDAAPTSHAFTGLPYDASFGLTILTQPPGVTCSFVRPADTPEITNFTATAISGKVADRDLSFPIKCTK